MFRHCAHGVPLPRRDVDHDRACQRDQYRAQPPEGGPCQHRPRQPVGIALERTTPGVIGGEQGAGKNHYRADHRPVERVWRYVPLYVHDRQAQHRGAGQQLRQQRQGARQVPAHADGDPRQQGRGGQASGREQVDEQALAEAQYDLDPGAGHEPGRRAGEEQAGHDRVGFPVAFLFGAEGGGHEESGGRQQQEAKPDVGLRRRAWHKPCQRGDEGNPGAGLYQQAEQVSAALALAQADPHHAGPFERPRRRSPAAVDRERDGERAEHHAKGEEGLDHQLELRAAAAPHGQRQCGVEHAKAKSRKRIAEFELLDQCQLQRKRGQRGAEDDRRVDVRFVALLLATGVDDRNGHVKQEE